MADSTNISWQSLRKEAISRVEELEFDGLVKFLRNRLSGRDALLADDRDGSPEYPVIAIDPHLKRLVREDLRRACVVLLGELIAGEWQDESSAHSLLLLCQRLVPDAAGERLRFLAESPRFAELVPALQFRIAQTLVELGTPLASNFWKQLAANDWTRFAAVCWLGLERNSPAEAIAFLADIPDDGAAVQKINFALPSFFKRLGTHPDKELLLAQLSAILPDLTAELRTHVHRWADRFQLPLRESPVATLISSITKQQVHDLCWSLPVEELDTTVLQPAL